MDENAKRKILDGLTDFPIGIVTHENLSVNDILAGKASIVLYLSDVFGLGADKHSLVEKVLLEALNIQNIPEITSVERMFKLSNGFLEDYNKVQFIKEKNKSFDNMYVTLVEVISGLGLTEGRSK